MRAALHPSPASPTTPSLPIIQAAVAPCDRDFAAALAWITEHRARLLRDVTQRGAVLLRGFAIHGADQFRRAMTVLVRDLARYRGGDSPRDTVGDRVYTSTSYPAELAIALHNELSYTRDYPAVIAFHCESAATEGGATPIADGRRALAELSPALIARLKTRRIRYIQNLHGGRGLGKSWQATFESADRGEVEALLAARRAEWEWRGDALRVVETVDPIIEHPSGTPALFCQAHLWHASTLDAKTRAALRRLVPEDELYHHCSYGDGTPIDDIDIAAIGSALARHEIVFAWRPGDVLVLDNVLVAHGRRPFRGPRRVLVAMGDPVEVM